MSACFQLRSADVSLMKKKNPNLGRSLRTKQQIDRAKRELLALRHLEIRRPAVPHRRHLRLTSCVCMLTRALVSCRIERFPWQMDEEKVRRVIREAVKIWSDVTPLTFTEVRRGIADIRIDFSSYWHGDNLPFDGPGGILAHAFFPKTHRQGDIHFDYDESWTLGNYMDLLQVAAHEFGHVLGLQHSRKPKTVMSAYYSFSYPLRLSEDDRLGIQYLYGAKPQVLPPPPTPAPRALVPKTETNELNVS
uniref:Matrix metallopeptidase 11a n=1 Tax=Xiphophorus couchianus TaxID=32473 RepID=A0A3B5LNY3_9TELE